MKKFVTVSALALAATLSALPVLANGETRKVCVDVKDKEGKPVIDPKTKQVKQNCKQVKQHNKLEGTKVPEKK